MSIWAALFLEFWKGYSSEITHRWDTTDCTPEEEHPRPQYMEQLKYVDETSVNVVTQTSEPKVPYWSRKVPGIVLSASVVLLMLLVVLAAVVGVILYRMSMILALSTVNEETIQVILCQINIFCHQLTQHLKKDFFRFYKDLHKLF